MTDRQQIWFSGTLYLHYTLHTSFIKETRDPFLDLMVWPWSKRSTENSRRKARKCTENREKITVVVGPARDIPLL